MRLFIAVEIGSDVQAVASRTIEELKRRVERSAPRARVTWVKPDHLHLTVRFIGHVETEVAEKILAILAPPLQAPVFDLTIRGMGTFPPRRPPRVIWAGIVDGTRGLHSIEQEVRSRLSPVLGPGEELAYEPHLTLGRVKTSTGLRPAVLLDGLEGSHFGVVQVRAVTLFESRLSSSGPTYMALGRTALAPA